MLSPHGGGRVCAVIGHPAHHSLSPAMHRAAYAALGLDWDYQWHDVAPDQLDGFVRGLDKPWRGLSVTMPHKEAIIAFGSPDEVVTLTGAGNTLVLGESPTVHNTDVAGVVNAVHLQRDGIEAITIVGNGATARSGLVGAARLGARRATVLARRPERATGMADLGRAVGVEVTILPLGHTPPAADLVFSTIPTSGIAEHAERLAGTAELLFDAVYDPWPTPLGQAAESTGTPILSGLHLLAGQAVDQVQLMTGLDIDLDTLLRAGLDELARRSAHGAVGGV
ncbi:shikimate dehydrogenase family protein [Aestuariimicrobium sp. Y1814]|uniref:shikimate dehydrogenase family protein n=1 Tax=Aestuariimicrobium sp. Y1814 TaxID=3418742 RepID=UPI003DA7488E